MVKEILYGETARTKYLSGITQLADSVKTTLGPKGRTAVIHERQSAPVSTSDGSAIVKSIDLDDSFENMGVQIAKNVAGVMNESVGDGAATAVLLTQSIFQQGVRAIASGHNPMELKKGIQGATQVAIAGLRKLSRPADTKDAIAHVAAVAGDDAEIGEMIAEAMSRVGNDGVISVEESPTGTTALEIREGMQLDHGLLSPVMVTDTATMTAELFDPYILVTDYEIMSAQVIAPILEKVLPTGKPLVIIAEKLEGEALATLVINKRNGVINAVALHPPAFGDGRREQMEDIAAMTGGIFITKDIGYFIDNVTLDMLGQARCVRADKNSALILPGQKSSKAFSERVSYLRKQIETTDYDFNKKRFLERLGKLTSGIAVISVGEPTEAATKEKKARVESALHTAKSAVTEGVVAGGGTAYLNASRAVKAYADTLSGEMRVGAMIVIHAMSELMRQIADNAGYSGSVVIAKAKELPSGMGFDVLTGEFVNMVDRGIVDSTKVMRLAITSAASAATSLLSSEAGIVDK